MESLFQSVQDEAGMRRPAHPPADDPAGIGVDDKGDIDEADPENAGRLEIVDGVQRIRTLSNFLTGKLILSDLERLKKLTS